LVYFTWFLGHAPSKVIVYQVPRSALERYSEKDIAWAKDCARKYGIKYRIVDR
jgi:hypothetical protein